MFLFLRQLVSILLYKYSSTLSIFQIKKRFFFIETYSPNRGIEFLIVRLLDDISSLDAVLVFIGSGSVELIEVLEPATINNKIYHKSAVAYNNILAFTSSADFGLITIENVCLNHIRIVLYANKLVKDQCWNSYHHNKYKGL